MKGHIVFVVVVVVVIVVVVEAAYGLHNIFNTDPTYEPG
jgi:hypothetical protein